ncbi:MAG: ABC transporter permease [Gemmatimonadota bacterium]|nr:ABC transporter permease [Gemmatimonadota bacterium]
MREALALIRASWLGATSYRLATVISLGGLLVSVVPIYFITGALQPVMSESIRNQGGEYFAFLLIGMIVFSFIQTAVSSLHQAVASGISTGTLEALLATRTPLPVLLCGLVGYGFLWTGVRALVLLAAAVAFGAQFAWGGSLAAVGILTLIVCAYLPFGLFAASSALAFRTVGPFPHLVLTASVLLGGVYFPTQVIPSWIERLSDFIPLTYGLRALRKSFLEGVPISGVAADLGILFAFAAGLTVLSLFTFSRALHYARRTGSLAQY